MFSWDFIILNIFYGQNCLIHGTTLRLCSGQAVPYRAGLRELAAPGGHHSAQFSSILYQISPFIQ